MNAAVLNYESNKIFRQQPCVAVVRQKYVSNDFYKKLCNFFMAGDGYYFVINHHTMQIEFISNEVKDILGYNPCECTIPFMTEKLHPQDVQSFMNFEQKTKEFFLQLPLEKAIKYKTRYDIRFRKENGEYARILNEGFLLEQDKNGGFLRSLNVHLNITYLTHDCKPILSFIGIDGDPCYYDVGTENIFVENVEELSKREKQILSFLIEGKPSKEIGNVLHISRQTVDTHRKNMIHKKHVSNTGELIGKAIRLGWL